MNDWPVNDAARALHADALVWDNHVCLPHSHDPRWLEELRRHHRAGADVVMVNLGDAQIPLETVISMANFYRSWILRKPEHFVLLESVSDLDRARAESKLAVAFNIEGMFTVADRIERIALFYELGVRWMLMAYNRNNRVAGGCHDEDTGLTAFGREVVEEMDRIGMVKCCTHTGYRSALDVLNHTDKPSIFSHSNPRALQDHGRNIPDELIRACAATGGVVCINGINLFLGGAGAQPRRMADHIDYIVDLVGADHVGLGLDYVYDQQGMRTQLASMPQIWPKGQGYAGPIEFVAPERLPEITEALLRRNYAERDIRKLLGENLLRVARSVWQQPYRRSKPLIS